MYNIIIDFTTANDVLNSNAKMHVKHFYSIPIPNLPCLFCFKKIYKTTDLYIMIKGYVHTAK